MIDASDTNTEKDNSLLTNEQVTETGSSDTRNSGIMMTNYVLIIFIVSDIDMISVSDTNTEKESGIRMTNYV